MIQTAKHGMVLLALAATTAFAANAVSPNGIPLLGEWDVEKGVVTANPANGVVDRELEIESVEIAKRHFDSGQAVFLDARSRRDYDRGRIEGAVSAPAYEFDEMVPEFLDRYGPDTYFITYCSGRTCEDSHILAQKLFENGYWEISVFIDGFPAWKSMGYPIEKSD